jgi:lipoyl(octanoyl) transferase
LTGVWLGRRRYAFTYQLQLALFELRKGGRIGDVALCLEHHPVITLGRGAKPEHLLTSREALAERGIDVEATDRGGEITLHAPGQLVCYPIVSLMPDRCDVRRYVKDLIACMRELIAPYGLDAGELPGLIGLWVDQGRLDAWDAESARSPAKIGAIGVRLSRWVSMHGFALNLDPDLSLFGLIVPCGVTQYGVCSLASTSGRRPTPHAVAPLACQSLAARLDRELTGFLDASAVEDEQLLDWLRAELAATRLSDE